MHLLMQDWKTVFTFKIHSVPSQTDQGVLHQEAICMSLSFTVVGLIGLFRFLPQALPPCPTFVIISHVDDVSQACANQENCVSPGA